MPMNLSKRQIASVIGLILIACLISSGITYAVTLSLSYSTTIEAGSMLSSASYIVSVDGSTYYAKNGTTGAIDFSGTNATEIIKNALSNANGIIQLLEGTFIIDNYIRLGVNDWLKGIGNATIIQQQNGANIDILIRANDVYNIKISDLVIDYNAQNNPSTVQGMSIASCSYIEIENCVFKNAKGFAIALTGSPTNRNIYAILKHNFIVSPLNNTSDMFLVVCDHAKVLNNYIIGTDANVALMLFESDYLTAIGNTIIMGAPDVGDGGKALGVYSLRHSIITGNNIIGYGKDTSYWTAGIWEVKEADNPGSYEPRCNQIIGNNIYNIEMGMGFQDSNETLVADNMLFNCSYGFYLPNWTTSSDYIHFSSNMLWSVSHALYNSSSSHLFFSNNYWNGTTYP